MSSDKKAPFAIRFPQGLREAIEKLGLDIEVVTKQYVPPEHPLYKSVFIATSKMGRDDGLSARIHWLKTINLTDESPLEEKLDILKEKFKEHMGLREVTIYYPNIKDPNKLIVQVDGCVFKNNKQIPREGYSIGFLEAYFGDKRDPTKKSIVTANKTLCDKSMEECKGKVCQFLLDFSTSS